MPITREDMRLVERVASRFVRRHHSSERDDLISDGMLGLIGAVETWESDRELREGWGAGRDAFLFRRVRLALIQGFRDRNGRASGGYPKQRFRENTDSLNATNRFAGELDRDLEDVGVREILDVLPDRERQVVIRSVLEGETEKQIGADLGVSESRVSQIRSQALSRLRGDNVPMPRSGPTEPLSSRQRDVLQRIADDKTNVEIARELHLSLETVKSHVRHILTRLGCRSRAGAVASALRAGLIA